MRSALTHPCLVLAVTLLGASAHVAVAEPQPPTQHAPSKNLSVDSETEAAVLATLQKALVPKIRKLQAEPPIPFMAEVEMQALKRQWRSEDEPVELYLRSLSVEIPLGQLHERVDEPWLRAPDCVTLRTSDGCELVVGPVHDQFIAAGLSDVAIVLEELVPGTSVPKALKADLATRFRFDDDFAIYRKLYTTPLHEIDPTKLQANELVELSSLLKLKRITSFTGADEGVRFFRSDAADIMANGRYPASRIVLWVVFVDDRTLLLMQAASREVDPVSRSCDESIMRNIAASVRGHTDPTPGVSMLRLAEKLLASEGAGQRKSVARHALVLALQYAGSWEEARRLLEENPPSSEAVRKLQHETLADLDAGLCLHCGETAAAHSTDHARCDNFTNGRVVAERAKRKSVQPQQDDGSN